MNRIYIWTTLNDTWRQKKLDKFVTERYIYKAFLLKIAPCNILALNKNAGIDQGALVFLGEKI